MHSSLRFIVSLLALSFTFAIPVSTTDAIEKRSFGFRVRAKPAASSDRPALNRQNGNIKLDIPVQQILKVQSEIKAANVESIISTINKNNPRSVMMELDFMKYALETHPGSKGDFISRVIGENIANSHNSQFYDILPYIKEDGFRSDGIDRALGLAGKRLSEAQSDAEKSVWTKIYHQLYEISKS